MAAYSIINFVLLTIFVFGIGREVRSEVVCPDKSTCPNGTTCCQMTDDRFGCCPLIEAVCCEDKRHCCPANSTCDLVRLRCISLNSFGIENSEKSIAPFSILDNSLLSLNSPKIPCGNNPSFSCPTNMSCCSSPFGHDGCCPTPNGECCSDFLHCCPEKFNCDVERRSCVLGNMIIPWFLKTSKFHFEKSSDIQHKGKLKYLEKLKHLLSQKAKENEYSNLYTTSVNLKTCFDNETSCQMANNHYGCCPETEAVCCNDMIHCCPKDSTCDIDAGTCRTTEENDKMLIVKESPLYILRQVLVALIKTEKFERKNYQSNILTDKMCKDKTYCGDNETCCPVRNQKFGCCPYPDAACCPDLKHCCPNGMRCSKRGCVPSIENKQDKVPESSETGGIICPDGKYQCPNQTTCCLIGFETYGCCPYSNAVCCSDEKHCCPEGFSCEAEQKCKERTLEIPQLLMNTSSKAINNMCPDKKHKCPDTATCCLLKTGVYGCCIYSHAVCCSDKEHCCPSGYTCDAKSQHCLKHSEISPMQVIISKEVNDNICPDKKSRCSSNFTCCLLASGKYGCCPYSDAVCCPDKVHCCPNGFICDAQTSHCIGSSSTSAFSKVSNTQKIDIKKTTNECPGENETCPFDYTCCPLSSGVVGCCRYANATCCSDGLHCCPFGTVCDLSREMCVSSIQQIPWKEKFPAIILSSNVIETLNKKKFLNIGNAYKTDDRSLDIQEIAGNSSQSIVCPGGAYKCPSDNTCCKMRSGRWGCCNAPHASCCLDGQHCCPRGFRCTPGGRCIRFLL